MRDASPRGGQPEQITHARLYRPSRERRPIVSITETQAKKSIAEKTDALMKNHENRDEKRAEKIQLQLDLKNIRSKLPASDNFLGNLTGALKKDTREKWARAAAVQNQIATLEGSISKLRARYNAIKGEIDDVVLGVVKEEAWWRKVSTVERYVVQLMIDARAYKRAVDTARHRANGILAEKIDDSLDVAGHNEGEKPEHRPPSYIQGLTLSLQQAYASGDVFLKTFNDYYSAMEKPPPWNVEIPIGKNVRVTLDLLQNRELLSLYTPDSIHVLEERLGYLSERLAAARKEINARLREIRTEKNKYFHQKKTKLSTHFA